MRNNEILFSVNIGWVQEEAKKYINRRLTDTELLSVKKGLECGLTTDIGTVFETVIEEAVEISKEEKSRKHVKNEN
jgi:hypothetical protein